MHPELIKAFDLVIEKKLSLEELYLHWWSGIPVQKYLPAIPQNLHDPISSKFLFAERGYEVHSIASKVVAVAPGEFIDLDEHISRIIRKSTWSSKWWNWLQTSSLQSYPHKRIIRIYIPTPDRDLLIFANEIFLVLESSMVPATLKYRRQSGIFSDCLVIWIEDVRLMETIDLISEVMTDSSGLSEPPPLAKKYLGMGLSDSPTNGESLGWLFSKIIWEAAKCDSKSHIQTELKQKNVDPDSPWLILPRSGCSALDLLK